MKPGAIDEAGGAILAALLLLAFLFQGCGPQAKMIKGPHDEVTAGLHRHPPDTLDFFGNRKP